MATTPTQMRLTKSDLECIDAIRDSTDMRTRTKVVQVAVSRLLVHVVAKKEREKKSKKNLL